MSLYLFVDLFVGEHVRLLWGESATEDLSVPPTAFPLKRRREVAEPRKLIFLFFGDFTRVSTILYHKMHHNSFGRFDPPIKVLGIECCSSIPSLGIIIIISTYSKTHNGESLPQSR